MSPRGQYITKQILGGGPDGREKYGVTVTFENSAGELLTMHQLGPPSEALRVVCAKALAIDPTFLVVAYSTPQTIYVDMAGGRSDHPDQFGTTNPQPKPEPYVLARVGLRHLCHPRLEAATQSSADRRVRGDWR